MFKALRRLFKALRRLAERLARPEVGAAGVTRIHADLEDNLRFKESLLSSAIDAIIAIDRKGIVKEFNIQAQQILGYDEEEAIGMKVDHFYFEKEYAKEVLGLLLKDKEEGNEGRLINHHTYMKTKEGKRIPILLSASLLGETGSVGFFQDLRVMEIYRRSIERLSGLLKAGQAITERDDLEDALGSTAEIIEKVLDADSVKLYVYDQEHEEILIPSARVAMGDGASGEYYARPDSMVRRIIDHAEIHFAENVQTDDLLSADFVADEDIRSCVACPLKVREKIVGVMICCYRAPHTFSEEEQVMIRLLASEVAIAIQNAILFQQNAQRVEELTQTKEYLETVLDHLEAHNKLALIGLVYGESIHSANSKLGMAMVKAADILEDYGDNDPQELKANARAIMDFIDSYLTEVNNFRKEALQLPDPVPVDLHRCLNQIIQSKRISRNIDIKWNLLATDALITAPENQLRQVFWVVIQNALDAMADGMGSLSLETNSEMIQHADFIRVSISDTGPGIPADLREKIFEYRESDTPRSGHSGFGLIWAHSFMGSYGGMIDFETTPDKGTTFHVYVPKDFQTETPWKRPE